jgi:endonuclease-3
VDRHVLRVSNRLGIAEGDDAVKVETQLCEALPKERWTRASDTLILHGRRICRPKPLCDQCAAQQYCDYFAMLQDEAQRAVRNPAKAGSARAKAGSARKPRKPARAGSARKPRKRR